jgi:hypothetical protein
LVKGADFLLNANEQITLSREEAIEVLKEVEIILISLHKQGAYYGEKFVKEEEKYRIEYERETTRFIDEWRVTERLAKVRSIISDKFDTTLGDDDMDDLERALEGIKYWSTPGDNL